MSYKLGKAIILFIILISLFGGQMYAQETKLRHVKDVSQDNWDVLSQRRIYFAHQSVGKNIMQGMQEVLNEMPNVKLRIVETSLLKNEIGGVFAHSREGRNENPALKCDEFKRIIEENAEGGIDIAFLKFCYADIYADTDINDLFKYYSDTFDYLTRKYPQIQFLHVTVPLTTSQETFGFKAKIKRLLRISFWGEEDNIQRNKFNAMLLEKYSKDGSVFDLARTEATSANGIEYALSNGNDRYYSLIPEYTDDGGHLNEKGRKLIAEELLLFLSSVSNKIRK